MEIPVSPGFPVRLRVGVNGPRGVREIAALLDTGASVLAITPDIAIELGYDLHKAPTTRVAAANGMALAPKILLSRVQMGEFSLERVPTVCLNVNATGASCLLGLNALARLNVFLDHKAGTLTITDP